MQKELSINNNAITKEKAEELALQKVNGVIKETILEKRNGIEVFVIMVETNANQRVIIEVEIKLVKFTC